MTNQEKDIGDRMKDLLDKQENKRKDLIGKCSHEVFQALCVQQEKDIFSLLQEIK